jgi:phosphoribosyl 1,2-cyclic phosphodiesterase
MKFCVLGSSSSGNCTLITCSGTTILVDAGLPLRYTADQIEKITGRDSLDGIFVSHEHSDHTRSLKAISGKYGCPVYLSTPVSWYLGREEGLEIREIRDRQKVRVGNLHVTPFLVSHDAIDPFGFVIEDDVGSMGLVTDLGCYDENLMDLLKDREALVVESNYDLDMLVNGRYPNYLKKRIQNGKGHLSNQQCRDLLGSVVGPRTRDIVLAHLSEENNDPLLAMETSMEVLECMEAPPELHVSYPRHPTTVVDLSRTSRV